MSASTGGAAALSDSSGLTWARQAYAHISTFNNASALPTVAQLAASYDVARATVTRTLRVLEAEGLVRVIPKMGDVPGRELASVPAWTGPVHLARQRAGGG